MVGTITQLVMYLAIGFVEMFLATARMSLIAKNKTVAASGIVFIENMVYFAILYTILNTMQHNWPVFVAYSMGGSLGTFVNLRKGV